MVLIAPLPVLEYLLLIWYLSLSLARKPVYLHV